MNAKPCVALRKRHAVQKKVKLLAHVVPFTPALVPVLLVAVVKLRSCYESAAMGFVILVLIEGCTVTVMSSLLVL